MAYRSYSLGDAVREGRHISTAADSAAVGRVGVCVAQRPPSQVLSLLALLWYTQVQMLTLQALH